MGALLDIRAGHYVLDACEAPGSKAAHVLETSPAVRLVAVNKDLGRLVNVSSTLERLEERPQTREQAGLLLGHARDVRRPAQDLDIGMAAHHRYRVEHHALSGHYLVTNLVTGGQDSFPSIEDAADAQRSLPVLRQPANDQSA